MPEEDMRRTFNLGIGFVLIVGERNVDSVMGVLGESGEKVVVVGKVI